VGENSQLTIETFASITETFLPPAIHQTLPAEGQIVLGIDLTIVFAKMSRQSTLLSTGQTVTISINADFTIIPTASLYLKYWDELVEKWSSDGIAIIEFSESRLVFTTSRMALYCLFLDNIPPQITKLTLNNQQDVSGNILTNPVYVDLTATDNNRIEYYNIRVYEDTSRLLYLSITVNALSYQTGSVGLDLTLENDIRYFMEVTAYDPIGNAASRSTDVFICKPAPTQQDVDNLLAGPNPFNPDTQDFHIQFLNSMAGRISLYIHSIDGKLVYSDSKYCQAGTNEFAWDGRDSLYDNVVNGVYFGILVVEDDQTKKMVRIAVLR
ncbi:hypothetical protein ACFL57_01965, partial [Candidatus Margulisiibacteriota bacterium]